MRLPLASALYFLVAVFLCGAGLHAAEPFFKKGDVVGLIGAEDIVVTSESGYLEQYLERSLPDLELRFRNLAWEGDTVFEQRRELNFPTWEEQLEKVGATVVIVQFGQMESLDGVAKLPDFITAYEALLQKFSDGGKRRIVVLLPNRFERSVAESDEVVTARNTVLDAYSAKIQELEKSAAAPRVTKADFAALPADWTRTRDGVHLSAAGQRVGAGSLVGKLDPRVEANYRKIPAETERSLLALIVAKNKLWFDYWRPQNWAFLAGDRTSQPSSRDHLDPSKRWFPPEREQFLPLVEAKEKEIAALVAQLAK